MRGRMRIRRHLAATACVLIAYLVSPGVVLAGEIVLLKIQGDVAVRSGMTEEWVAARAGNILAPDATIRTGMKSSAVIEVNGSPGKRMTVPPEVMVEMGDVRELTQEELILKLTMERVKSTSYEWKRNELNIPNMTAMHGSDRSPSKGLMENDVTAGVYQLNGARVLFDHGFYSTSALRVLDVLRRYPRLGEQFNNRILVARALEHANLRGEALNEYAQLLTSEQLTPEQRDQVKSSMDRLKTKRDGR